MTGYKKTMKYIAMIILLCYMSVLFPYRVTGEVKPITEVQERLAGITQEERTVLENLFKLSQEMDELSREETRISAKIDEVQGQITDLEAVILQMKKAYDKQLNALKKILVNYQKGGPATYLEILLGAESLYDFLKGLNLIKDISYHTTELLNAIETSKKEMDEHKERLAEQVHLLTQKKEELKEPLRRKRELREEQEAYLEALQGDRVYYQEQLANLEQAWADVKIIFQDILQEFTRIIGEGHFTMGDLNLLYEFPYMKGAIYEETFNQIIREHSSLPNLSFRFQSEEVILEVQEKQLKLTGRFLLEGDSILKFQVEKGSFYHLPLEATAINELFKGGFLLIDFMEMAGDLLIVRISIEAVQIREGYLEFLVLPEIKESDFWSN